MLDEVIRPTRDTDDVKVQLWSARREVVLVASTCSGLKVAIVTSSPTSTPVSVGRQLVDDHLVAPSADRAGALAAAGRARPSRRTDRREGSTTRGPRRRRRQWRRGRTPWPESATIGRPMISRPSRDRGHPRRWRRPAALVSMARRSRLVAVRRAPATTLSTTAPARPVSRIRPSIAARRRRQSAATHNLTPALTPTLDKTSTPITRWWPVPREDAGITASGGIQ